MKSSLFQNTSVFSLLCFSFTINAQSLVTFQDSVSTLYGYKNKSGKIVVAPQFIHAIEQQYPKILFGLTDSGWVAFNTKGQYLFTAFTFNNGPDYFSNGLMRMLQDNKVGYANKKGRIVIPPAYLYAEPFKKGRAKVSRVPRQHENDSKKCHHFHNTYDVIDKRGRIRWAKEEEYNPLRETRKK